MDIRTLSELTKVKVERSQLPTVWALVIVYFLSIVTPSVLNNWTVLVGAEKPKTSLTVGQTVAMVKYTTTYYIRPQLVDFRSYLVSYYPQVESGITDDAVEQFLRGITHSYSDTYRRELNSMPLAGDHIGDWYVSRFPYDDFFRQIRAITGKEETYQTELDRLQIIDRKVDLLGAWLWNFHSETAESLRDHLNQLSRPNRIAEGL